MAEQHSSFDAFDRQCEDLRNKWLRHRANPEVWAIVEEYGNKYERDMLNCILELRARVEALEAAESRRQQEVELLKAALRQARQEAAMNFNQQPS